MTENEFPYYSMGFYLYRDNNEWKFNIDIDDPIYRTYLFLDPFRSNRYDMDTICGRFMKDVRR